MNGIEFTDPPQLGRNARQDFWAEVVAALRQRPGEWARIQTDVPRQAGYNRASDIRKGRLVAFADARYEARLVLTDEKKGDLYVRAIQ